MDIMLGVCKSGLESSHTKMSILIGKTLPAEIDIASLHLPYVHVVGYTTREERRLHGTVYAP